MSDVEIRIALDALAEGVPRRFDRADGPVVLIRDGDHVVALEGACPHAGAPLDQGALCDGRLICPWHKAAFAVADGSVLEPPALLPLARYAVRIEGGSVVVGGRLARPDAQPAREPGTIAIVGTGAAASGALALLAMRGHRGRVVLIGPEAAPPYDRTVLSKMVVAGSMPAEPKPVLEEGAWPVGVERVVGTVRRLDAGGRRIEMEGGAVLTYDQALLASGAAPKRLSMPGCGLEGVHVLRNVGDAAALVGSIEGAARAVVVGAGFIGLEVASGLRERGVETVVVSGGEVPLAAVLGARIGRRVRRLHEDRGVVFRTGSVARFEGEGRVARVVLEDATVLQADLVVLGTGVTPEVGFVDGVTVEDGVVVDGAMRAAPGLFAAGDLARFPYRGEMVRIEHWRVAQQHGWLAARNMLGEHATYEGVPFFWTAQHGVRLDYLGHAAGWDAEELEGDLEGMDFVARLIRGGRVVAVVGCGRDAEMARLSDAVTGPLGGLA